MEILVNIHTNNLTRFLLNLTIKFKTLKTKFVGLFNKLAIVDMDKTANLHMKLTTKTQQINLIKNPKYFFLLMNVKILLRQVIVKKMVVNYHINLQKIRI